MKQYLKLISKIRHSIDSPVIRSTFLVGFPGETHRHFSDLLEFQQKAQLNWAGIFTYSAEESTVAYNLKNRVKKSVSLARKQQLQQAQEQITANWLDLFCGQSLPVLLEEKVEQSDLYLGRSFLQAPDVDGLMVVHADNAEPGQRINTKIIKRNGVDLEAIKNDE